MFFEPKPIVVNDELVPFGAVRGIPAAEDSKESLGLIFAFLELHLEDNIRKNLQASRDLGGVDSNVVDH